MRRVILSCSHYDVQLRTSVFAGVVVLFALICLTKCLKLSSFLRVVSIKVFDLSYSYINFGPSQTEPNS